MQDGKDDGVPAMTPASSTASGGRPQVATFCGMSISSRLALLGLGHRRADENGRHRIFRVETGETLGFCHAHEAVERFLKSAGA